MEKKKKKKPGSTWGPAPSFCIIANVSVVTLSPAVDRGWVWHTHSAVELFEPQDCCFTHPDQGASLFVNWPDEFKDTNNSNSWRKYGGKVCVYIVGGTVS